MPSRDQWYADTAKRSIGPDVYLKAAQLLIDEKKGQRRKTFPWDTDGFRAPTKEFIDGIEYDGRKPNDYLAKFAIGLKGSRRSRAVVLLASDCASAARQHW